jgi:hypothetical protein
MNGKMIKIWTGNIMGKPPQGSKQELSRLKEWMEGQGITTPFDLSMWDARNILVSSKVTRRG